MHTESSILINAPMSEVFAMTSDLTRWPACLPHYRWVRWIEGGPESGIVQMAALRGSIPIKWISEYRRDAAKPELWFRHLSAFTKGMEVRWIYEQRPGGVYITIDHELSFRWPLLAPVANPVIGEFMIGWVAPRTLSGFKKLLESNKGHS
ncbi:MAG: SRPBCC family protein [Verrucomicrobia bacterium]|nr:SRPBCC family protein [Verrucomicrobiota bacterium]